MATAVAAAVIAANTAGAAAGTAAAFGAATAFAISAGAALVDLALTSAYQKKKASDLKDFKPTQDVTLRSAVAPRPIVYGETRVSGPLVYGNQRDTPGTDDNSEIWQCIAICGHEVEDITDVWLDGDQITDAQINSSTGAITGGKYSSPAGVVNIYRYLGADDQVASAPLVAAFSDWTSSHRMRGVAYLVTRFELGTRTSQALWGSGAPTNIRAIVRGKKVYDPRLDGTTATGTGTHRVDDPTTWEWSDNPALCLADYIIDDKLGMGVEGMLPADIDYSYVATAADHCDELVDIPGSTTQKRYTCNGAIYTTQTYADNIASILSSMNGTIIRTGGKLIIRAGEYEAPPAGFDFTGDDVIGPVQIQPQRSRTDRFNTVRGQFLDPDQNYAASEFLRVTDSDLVTTRDDGQEIVSSISLPMTNDEFTAQRIAFKRIKANNQQLRAVVPMNFRAMKVAPGDRITLTIDELSWSSKIFRVESWKFEPDKGFMLEVREDSSTAYADPLVGDYASRSFSGVITFGQSAVPSASGLTATATDNGIILEWEAPRPSSNYDEVVLFASATSAWSGASEVARGRFTSYLHKLDSGTQRYYWTRAEASDGRTSVRDPDSDTSSITATAGVLDFADIGGATRPEENADVTALHAINAADNPEFEAGDVSWTATGGWGIVLDATNARRGSWSARFTGGGGAGTLLSNSRLQVNPGDRVLVQGFAKKTAGPGSFRIQSIRFNSSGALVSAGDGNAVSAATYSQSRIIDTVPAGISFIAPRFTNATSIDGSTVAYADGVVVTIIPKDADTDALGTTNAPVDAGATANDIQTVTDSDTGTASATATINRLGGQTEISVFVGISGTATAGTGAPYPVTVTLRRGGVAGTLIRTWTGLSGGHEPGGGGDPDVAYMGVNLSHIDTNTGTGSTDYYVLQTGTSYTRAITIEATQTFDVG